MINPQDWYWVVGGSTTQVYSSKRNIYVPLSDTAYLTWLTVHPAASIAADETDLWYYVKDFQPWWMWDAVGKIVSQPSAGAWRQAQLAQYNSDTRTRKVAGGMTAAGIPVKTDDVSRGFINDARTHADANASYTTQWYGSDGNFYPADAATIITMSDAVTTHTTNCYLIFSNVATEIIQSTITTTAQIDTAYAGV